MGFSFCAEKHMFPIFLKLESRPVLVVGAGAIAEGKIEGLVAERASVKVIAPEATPQIRQWASAGGVEWEQRPYRTAAPEGEILVIVPTSSPQAHSPLFTYAAANAVPC